MDNHHEALASIAETVVTDQYAASADNDVASLELNATQKEVR